MPSYVPLVDLLELIQLAVGLVLAGIVAIAAYSSSALTARGALAAAIAGTLTFGIGGLAPAILLLTFFISSSLLSRRGRNRKLPFVDRAAKGGARDEWQVAANGAIPTLMAVGFGITEQSPWLIGIAGALAASNADTWATEVGMLAQSRPRLITNLRSVDPGTSGAITWLGTAASLAGAILIGLIAALFFKSTDSIVVIALAGLIASLVDSFLGATVQAQYHCAHCDQITERHPIHSCGTPTVHVRGLTWMGNDQVNFVASAVGAVLAIWVWIALS